MQHNSGRSGRTGRKNDVADIRTQDDASVIGNIFADVPQTLLEEQLILLQEPQLETFIYPMVELVWKLVEPREVFTGTYEFFTNPHFVILPRDIDSLYHYRYWP